MALTINGTRFLAHRRADGLALRQTLVVGRQGLFAPPSLLRPILAAGKPALAPEDEAFFATEHAEWADPVFRALGAAPLEFLDASPYEGATRLHDLNRPIDATWEESVDTLIDVGSLEHIFDAKTAVENYLRLVRPGGSVLLLDMPAVNFCGHGFYQFSPEFFCEVFSARHGFQLASLALAESWSFAPFYSVSRPRDVRSRVEILGQRPAHLFVHAVKVAPFHGFSQSVVQSDYAEAWARPAAAAASSANRGLLEPVRQAWRRIDLAGYWKFSTRRDQQRLVHQRNVARSDQLAPLHF